MALRRRRPCRDPAGAVADGLRARRRDGPPDARARLGDQPAGRAAGLAARAGHAVATMLASRAQIIIFWGPDHCALYNDAYIADHGQQTPRPPGPARPARCGPRPGRCCATCSTACARATRRSGPRTTRSCWSGTAFSRRPTSTSPTTRSARPTARSAASSASSTRPPAGCSASAGSRTLSALGRRLADSPDQAALVAETAAVFGENARRRAVRPRCSWTTGRTEVAPPGRVRRRWPTRRRGPACGRRLRDDRRPAADRRRPTRRWCCRSASAPPRSARWSSG